MDWTKAKNIIILALVATNLFLIFTYAGKSVFGTANTNDEALMRILAERGISVETQIPKKSIYLPIIQCEYADIENEDVKALMRSQVALSKDSDDDEYVAKAEEFLSYLGIMSDNVSKGEIYKAETAAEGETNATAVGRSNAVTTTEDAGADDEKNVKAAGKANAAPEGKGLTIAGAEVDDVTPIETTDASETGNDNTAEAENDGAGSEKTVIFKNEIDGIPLEGNFIKCIFRNGLIDEFQCVWLTPTETSGRKMETISASVALMSLTNSDENSNIEINKIEMVYWVPAMGIDVDKTVSDTAFPTWKITTSAGKEFYVEAVQL